MEACRQLPQVGLKVAFSVSCASRVVGNAVSWSDPRHCSAYGFGSFSRVLPNSLPLPDVVQLRREGSMWMKARSRGCSTKNDSSGQRRCNWRDAS